MRLAQTPLAAALLLLTGGCSPAPKNAESSSEARPLDKRTYEAGFVQFVNRNELPNTSYHLRGKMDVTVWDTYVRVEKAEDRAVFYIPRERLIYVGQEIPVRSVFADLEPK
jgi:hypothetical protein